jgi:hypothetical protein
MGKSSRQKNEKIDKRKKRSALKKKAAIKQKMKNATIEKRLKEYPVFHFQKHDSALVSERFVNEVKRILRSLRFDDQTLFQPIQQKVFKQMKQHGFEIVMDAILDNDSYDDQTKFNLRTNFLFSVGDALYNKLAEKKLIDNYIPYNDVDIAPHGFDFGVRFNGMFWEKTKWGKIYYSKLKPKVTIDGKEYIVALSRHAIERICDRCVGLWKRYAGAGDAYGLISRYTKYDVIETYKGREKQYFLTFYEKCNKFYSSYHYVKEVLKDYDPDEQYYYRVGYCPIGFSDDFVSAITLLAPGMRGTPEYLMIKDSNLSYNEKQHFDKLINLLLKNEYFSDSSNYDAVRWFHENGIPQVLKLEDDPFVFK